MVDWIAEGSLLRADKIRRGNLRWLEAGKVPSLLSFFNAKDAGQEMPKVQFSTADAGNQTQTAENFAVTQNFPSNDTKFVPTENSQQGFVNPQMPVEGFCIIHTDTEAKYFCETCLNLFCKACPNSYGGSVKICPMCGSMCQSIEKQKNEAQKTFRYQHDMRKGFGFGDFGEAMFYPLKFKTSFFLGGIIFMFLTLGQSASGTGNIFLIAASLICFILSNMLTFGILARVTESFSQGKVGVNFMPTFDEFTLWDDMIKPFFLSLAAYFVSFGLMIVLIIGMVWYMFNQISGSMSQFSSDTIATKMETANKARNISEFETRRAEMHDDHNFTNPNYVPQNFQNSHSNLGSNGYINREEEEFAELDKMVEQMRKEQLESTIGRSPEEEQAQIREMATKIIKTGGIFVVLIFLAFLWAVFYFPAACCVAGYTRSVSATLNPSVGLDIIKRLGADYWKILGMGLILIIISVLVNVILNIILMPFNLPRMGNLAVIAIESWFIFYVSIVFSVILGFALYKNSEKINLFRR